MKPRGKLMAIINQGHEEEVSSHRREREREREQMKRAGDSQCRTGGYCFKFVWCVHTPGNNRLPREEMEAASSK